MGKERGVRHGKASGGPPSGKSDPLLPSRPIAMHHVTTEEGHHLVCDAPPSQKEKPCSRALHCGREGGRKAEEGGTEAQWTSQCRDPAFACSIFPHPQNLLSASLFSSLLLVVFSALPPMSAISLSLRCVGVSSQGGHHFRLSSWPCPTRSPRGKTAAGNKGRRRAPPWRRRIRGHNVDISSAL